MPFAATNCTTTLAPPVGEAGSGQCGQARAAIDAAPRLVKARSLLSAKDLARIERLARESGSAAGGASSPLLVFSRGEEKYVASLDGSVPSNAVVERLADGQATVLAKVVGG